MTLVELNSTELDLIIYTLNLQKQRLLKKQLLEKQPLPQLIEDRPYDFQYLIKKLEITFTSIRRGRGKEQEMSSSTNFSNI
jgi:hypothetical protein